MFCAVIMAFVLRLDKGTIKKGRHILRRSGAIHLWFCAVAKGMPFFLC